MSLIVFIVVLSILIIVHEWGHFITARKLGVRVEKFSVGFGKKIFSHMHDGTEFMICAIPLGGYVKMAGDEREECIGTKDEFYSHSVGHRAAIVLMGPVVNYVFAYLCFVLLFLAAFPGQSMTVQEIDEGGAAYEAGIQAGDKIVALDSRNVYSELQMDRMLAGGREGELNVDILRGSQRITKIITPDVIERDDVLGEKKTFMDMGIGFYNEVAIGEVLKDSPAEKAGLRPDDKVIQVGEVKTLTWEDVHTNIANSQETSLLLKIERDGVVIEKELYPTERKIKTSEGEKQIRMIGIVRAGPDMEMYRFGLVDSVRYAWEELWGVTKLTLRAVYSVVVGARSAKDTVGGPIRIFGVVSDAAAMGASYLVLIMAIISASLAIFNLFPIPVLDGGHLFFLIIEKIRNAPLPMKLEEGLTKIGFSLLMCLMLFVLYNDIVQVGWIEKISEFVGQFRGSSAP